MREMPMLPMRLIRDEDAQTVLETTAFLARRHGLPSRPIVPSPLGGHHGIDDLAFDPSLHRSVHEWAQFALTDILNATGLPKARFVLVARETSFDSQPDLLTFDPVLAHEKGRFTTRLLLELARADLRDFDLGFEPDPVQRALITLTGCAFRRQGFVLTNCLTALSAELADRRVSKGWLETALVSAACLGLLLRGQSPEQIVATYGSILSPSVRRHVRKACRQWEDYGPELQLLRLQCGATPAQGDVRPARGLIFTRRAS